MLFYEEDKQKKDQPIGTKENKQLVPATPAPNAMKNSVLLEGEQQKGWCGRCCACVSLSYYKDYFQVTNNIVLGRILCAMKFWDGRFFQQVLPPKQQAKAEQAVQQANEPAPKQNDSDLYGPIWLYTTAAFLASAVHNVYLYNASSTFSYDFDVVGIAFTLFHLFGFGYSTLMGMILKCLSVESRVFQIISLYGYSIFNYIPCLLLSMLNIPLLTYLFVIYAVASKAAFIYFTLRNTFEIPASKQVLLIVLILGEAVIQGLLVRFLCLQNYTSNVLYGAHHSLHLRNYFMH